MYQLIIGPNSNWTAAPSLNAPRTSHTCSVITTAAETLEIVVVGGSNGGTLNSVQIFDVDNNVWRTGWERYDLIQGNNSTGLGKRVVPRLCELVHRGQRESGGGIHAT